MTTQPALPTDRRPRWPWVFFGLGLVWTVFIRVPLVLNAADHLDSDLAVDGLTLLDALQGHWRWHFPGTPYLGILPLLFCYPQSLIWGAHATTLVSGGTVIWVLVVASAFWLAWKTSGPRAAGWAVVPLACSSLGTIWLSGRITGGHLLTLVWHNLAFVLLHACLADGGWKRTAVLGFWCGLGLYLDAMFLLTLAGLIAAALLLWFRVGVSKRGISVAALFLVTMAVGLLPREIGRRVDPYDAYPAQFGMTFEKKALLEHARLLGQACIPRMVAGLDLSVLESEIDMVAQWGGDVRSGLQSLRDQPENVLLLGRVLCGTVSLASFAAALFWLALDRWPRGDLAGRAIRLGILGSAAAIVVAFLLNRNIYNSDNYRYLVFLLTPWALGFGTMERDLASLGWLGRLAAIALALLLALTMTLTALSWYVRDLRYIDPRLVPLPVEVRPWDQVEVFDPHPQAVGPGAFTTVIPHDVTHLFGPYWDVYRLSFLSGKRVVGIPFPTEPNRFAGWTRGLGPDRGRLMVLQPFLVNWRDALSVVWRAEGRDPAELARLHIFVPSRESPRH
jgi:hypothetical protein